MIGNTIIVEITTTYGEKNRFTADFTVQGSYTEREGEVITIRRAKTQDFGMKILDKKTEELKTEEISIPISALDDILKATEIIRK